MILLLFDISGGEFLVILIAIFLVFGPKKMPEIARYIGRGMNELKKVTGDITKEFQDGVRQVKNEVDQIKSDVLEKASPLTQEMIAGPEVFPEDAEPLSQTQSPEEPVKNISESKENSPSPGI